MWQLVRSDLVLLVTFGRLERSRGLADQFDEGGRPMCDTSDEPGHPETKMVRIAVRPAWVGVLDFVTRFPGGTNADEFADRGR